MFRIVLLTIVLLETTGCMISPRINFRDRLTFDLPPPVQAPMSYSDMLCSTYSIYNT